MKASDQSQDNTKLAEARQKLQHFYELVGEQAVLLPVPCGSKRPIIPNWQRITFNETCTPKYRVQLKTALRRGSNIGVLLGPSSGNLCAVDIDSDDAVETFRELNPQLRNSLTTRGANGCQIWVIIDSEYPARRVNSRLKIPGTTKPVAEWRGGGGHQSILSGRHPNGMDYQFIVEASAVRIAFSEINWPVEWGMNFENGALPSVSDTVLPGQINPELWNRILRYIEKVDIAVSGQGGSNPTFRLANVLVHGFKLSREQAYPFMKIYSLRCVPPWSDKEIWHKIDDALKAEHDKPRGYLRGEDENSTISTDTLSECVPIENVEFVEFASSENREGRENSTNSTISTSTHTQKAVFPTDSILQDYFNYAVSQTEGADCYIIGSILPVCAALLARRVYLSWSGASKLYPNLFTMLAGKPGDRKSSTIDIAESIARYCLPSTTFLPAAFSPETLFDEYDGAHDGQSDKIWIRAEANPVLIDFQKTQNGERNAARFLELYDCKGLSESYRRNKEKKDSCPRRTIAETCTSVVFGATFSACQFHGQAIRTGLERRFLYYVAEGHGRVIVFPENPDSKTIDDLRNLFFRLTAMQGPVGLSEEAKAKWQAYQHDNRRLIKETDPLEEMEGSRLASAPTHVLKIALLFEACRQAMQLQQPCREIRSETLSLAIEHVAESFRAARFLDKIVQRVRIAEDAEVLLAKIRADFRAKRQANAIILSKTELTSKFCPGLGRGFSIYHLYHQLIPWLEAHGDAKRVQKTGKLEYYAFRVGE
jgi:hypothetical protein